MKRRLLLLVAAGIAAGIAAETVRFAWDANAPEEQVTGYFLYSAPNVTGPFTVLGAVGTNTSLSVTMNPARAFFYVTASNLWGESLPSNVLTTPAPARASTSLVIRLIKP